MDEQKWAKEHMPRPTRNKQNVALVVERTPSTRESHRQLTAKTSKTVGPSYQRQRQWPIAFQEATTVTTTNGGYNNRQGKNWTNPREPIKTDDRPTTTNAAAIQRRMNGRTQSSPNRWTPNWCTAEEKVTNGAHTHTHTHAGCEERRQVNERYTRTIIQRWCWCVNRTDVLSRSERTEN